MIFGSRARLRRSEKDPFEGVERFAEGFKRRRKPFRKPPRKRVSSRGSVGRTRDSTQERALAPQPRGGDGVTGGVQPPEGLPPLGLTQHGQSSALSTSPEAPEPQLSPQHWNNGTPKNAQLYPIPEDSPSVPPPPVPHPQLITPTGRPPTDEDTDGINLDFLVSGEMRTFRGFYTRLEYHSTVSPRLARLSRHGIQFRPPAAGPGRQATMTLCIPVCIPNVYRGCRERDVVMEVDEFLGAADFCVGVGVLEKIKAVKAGLDLDVGPGPVSLSTGDLTPVLRMNTPAPTLGYGNWHQDTIHARGMDETAHHPPQPAQPIVSPAFGHDLTLLQGTMNGGDGAAVTPGETHIQRQVSVPGGWTYSYVTTPAPNALGPMVDGVGIDNAEYYLQDEEFGFLAPELLEGDGFYENSFRNYM